MNWAKEGILFLRYIFDEYGNIVSYESLTKTFELKGTFQSYKQLKHNIPKQWLLTISKEKHITSVAPFPKCLEFILSPLTKLVDTSVIQSGNNEKLSSTKQMGEK